MRHDTGAGRELIRQFNEAKVLAIEHTSVERQLGERSGDTRHSESTVRSILPRPIWRIPHCSPASRNLINP